jgi:hypothetical protein
MLGANRQFAELVKRRERVALLLVGLCSGLGFATACTGRSAFLQQPCSTFHRPDSSESRCVDQIAVVSTLPSGALVPPPPALPRIDPPIADAIERNPGLPPGPLGWLLDGPPVSLRGPPSSADSSSVADQEALEKEKVACRTMKRGSSGSS